MASILVSGDASDDLLDTSANVNLITPAGASVNSAPGAAAPDTAAAGSSQSVALPLATAGAADGAMATADDSAEGESADGTADDGYASTDDSASSESSGSNESTASNESNDSSDNNQAPSTTAPPRNNEPDDPTKVKGYDVHTFTQHANDLLGGHMLAAGQGNTGGWQWVGPYEIQARSTITALQPVIEQGITDVLQRNPGAQGEELERKVAKRLTELNDWKNLDSRTRENMMVLSGVDIAAMDKRYREDTVNHLLHSPLPFGDIDEVLTPDVTVNLGYTHTLDKDWTQVAHLGNGIFQVWMVSNNNNGSHTGHEMGSFKVQLTATTSLDEARRIGNEMVENRNKNNKLYLDEAARRLLYGQTEWLDFSYMSPEERRAVYAGKRLGEGGPPPGPDTGGTTTTTAPEDTTTTTPDGDTTTTTVGESTTTTAADDGDTTTTAADSGDTTTTAAGGGDDATTTTAEGGGG